MSFEPTHELRSRFERLVDLAPLPGSSPKAIERLQGALVSLGDDAELPELIEQVCRDPALAARVIGLANSAFFARAVPVETIELASARIGARRVRRLLFLQRVSDALADHRASPLLEEIWQRAIAVAHLAEAIADHVDSVDPDRAFASGLLHDMGSMIIADRAPELMQSMLEPEAGVTVHEYFQRHLGATPTDVGRSAARQHDFPSPIAEVMVGYANPRDADPPVVRVIHVARALSGMDDRFPILAQDRTELAFDVCQSLGLTQEALDSLQETAQHWVAVSRSLA
ncbi:MAG: HDOD domain-containing protein [Myxococcota bacterium]